MVMAPIVRGRKGEYKKDLEKLARQGFVRARIDGVLRSLDEDIPLDKRKNHTIEVVVDRLLVKAGDRETPGSVHRNRHQARQRPGADRRWSTARSACIRRSWRAPNAAPASRSWSRDRSPSTVRTAPARNCHGLGSKWTFDPAKVIVDSAKPLLDGGLGPGAGSWHMQQQPRGARQKESRINLDKPFEELPKKARETLMEGAGGLPGILAILDETYRSVRPKPIASGSRITCRPPSVRPATASACVRPASRCA